MIQVSNLSYSYKSGTPLLFPDFVVQQGEHCLLLGESGSGKTTLLHLVGGLLRGYSGNIVLSGKELSSLSGPQLDHFRGQSIGFIFQRNHLVKAMTVEQNILLAPFLSRTPVDRNRLTRITVQLDLATRKGNFVNTLSHGQAQRVAIARAIINQPAVILADEPTSALDDRNCERVVGLLHEVASESNATLLIATHDQRLKDRFQKRISLAS